MATTTKKKTKKPAPFRLELEVGSMPLKAQFEDQGYRISAKDASLIKRIDGAIMLLVGQGMITDKQAGVIYPRLSRFAIDRAKPIEAKS